MPRGKHLNDQKIHTNLYKQSDRLGRLKIIQKDLAAELGITIFAMSRVIKRMEEAGRIKRLTSHQGTIWTYVIRDPERFK
jgi:DNA-binding MarR family transcriptional regulator